MRYIKPGQGNYSNHFLVFCSMDLTKEAFMPFIYFKTSRSGGKGGQHVNKVSSKVELNLDVNSCIVFSEEQKARLRHKLASRMTSDGMIQVISQNNRSQFKNKESAIDKLFQLLQGALLEQKPRKISKPKKSAIEKRLKDKQALAMKKLYRRKDY